VFGGPKREREMCGAELMTNAAPPVVDKPRPPRRGLAVLVTMGVMALALLGYAILLISRLSLIARRAEVTRPAEWIALVIYPAVMACLYALALLWLRSGSKRGRVLGAVLLCQWAWSAASLASRIPSDEVGSRAFQVVTAVALVVLALFLVGILPPPANADSTDPDVK
jgi:hypothetical protein